MATEKARPAKSGAQTGDRKTGSLPRDGAAGTAPSRAASARPARGRSRQKEETAAGILQAARELFAELGYEATTTRAIAERAGVAVGTVFAHYPDKNHLLGETLRAEIQQVLAQTLSTVPPKKPLEDRLVHLSAGLLTYYVEQRQLSRELIRHATFQEGEEADAFNRQMRDFVGVCRQQIEAAIAAGELPVGCDPGALARCYLAFHFYVVNACLRGEPITAQDALRQLRALVRTLLAGYTR